MKEVVFDNPHRKKHFEFFRNLNHPHFNITASVKVGSLIKTCKEKEISVHLALVYLISRIANEIPEFRWRIRGDQIIEHVAVHPSFTVPTETSDVFSFCEVKYDKDSKVFLERAMDARSQRWSDPHFEDEKDRDNYIFLSSFPWVAFTGYQHAMQFHPHDSVPRISWGKILETNGVMTMPLSVQVHHAIVDGSHVGQYFEMVESYALQTNFL
ncbi:MAG: chloramphenicol acetyltransferase [Bacteroidia bacterium]|nr:chloramphenicol acetyltransferase [Bacteroidia bacterium]